jgi:hypothetical protein
MCLPDYVYGLILIESLGDEAALGTIHCTDSSGGRKPRTIYRPPVKILPTDYAEADNVVPAGA